MHDYSENMEAKIATFSLKGKADIWWEYVKNVKGVDEYDLTWNVFERRSTCQKYTLMIELRSFMSCGWVLRQMRSILERF